MDPRRAMTERNAHFTRGPRFYREAGAVMFEFVIDAGNMIGPRLANKPDSEKHPEAWSAFTRAEALADLAREDAVEILGAPLNAAVEQIEGPPIKRAYTRRKSPNEAV